jgi:DNA mismatch endonuclease, patch repair protein
MDRVSTEVRSKIMAAVRSRGGITEQRMEALLRAKKLIGFRRQWPVAGKPDFAWPKLRVALFVDGCFWHGCRCKRPPKSNASFWESKVVSNRRRDLKVTRRLRKEGWTVLRVWECAVSADRTIARIARALLKQTEKRLS